MFQNLTDTDNTSIFYVFNSNLSCSVDEKAGRNVIFEVLIKSKVFNRLDLSDNFWEQFNAQNKDLKEQVGLCENIDNANTLTVAINSKEYFENIKAIQLIQKIKVWKKILLEFQKIFQKNWSKKISSSKGFDENEICYFHVGIVSLPFGHFLLTKVREEKEKYRTNLHTSIKE